MTATFLLTALLSLCLFTADVYLVLINSNGAQITNSTISGLTSGSASYIPIGTNLTFQKTFLSYPILTLTTHTIVVVNATGNVVFGLWTKFIEIRLFFLLSIISTAVAVHLTGKYLKVFQNEFKSTLKSSLFSFIPLIIFTVINSSKVAYLPPGLGTLIFTTVGMGYVLTKQQVFDLHELFGDNVALNGKAGRYIAAILIAFVGYILLSIVTMLISFAFGKVIYF